MTQDSSAAKYSQEMSLGKHQRRWQKTYGAMGFKKGYNMPLFIILAGAMFGFCLARTEYFSTANFVEGSAPGEWYWYQSGHYRIAIFMHIGSVIPAGLLMVWHFLPIIRQRLLIFHLINGYVVILLLLIGVASALMLTRRSFGGEPVTQAGMGTLAIIIIVSLAMAYYNIKRLQIDQHRAWMLRAAVYSGTIITIRIIMIIAAQILPMTGAYYTTFSCDELATISGPRQFRKSYPECFVTSGTNHGEVAVHASFEESAATVGAALQLGFSMGVSTATISYSMARLTWINRHG